MPPAALPERIDTLLLLTQKTFDLAPEKCIHYCNQLIEISEASKLAQLKAKALLSLSSAYSVKGDMDASFKYAKEH